MENAKNTIKTLWSELYSNSSNPELEQFLESLDSFKNKFPQKNIKAEWWKDAVVYSLYVDMFGGTFDGLIEKLDYLQNLGVNCLWLLPILDSPMRDGGFDIRKYNRVRKDLLGLGNDATDEQVQAGFKKFLDAAHSKNLKVIFDIAINHISEEHEWFVKAKADKNSKYRDYFIWNDNDKKYNKARLLFKGMIDSNWEKEGDQYFFHRFYPFQPDLNYRNPKVLLEMTDNFLYWLSQDVDGFRADAIPYLWKEEETPCENEQKTHTIVKFIRAVLDYVRPGVLLLAEACQPPKEVVEYFGNNDECNAAYHFPLMPMIFKAMAIGDKTPIINVLKPEITPEIPQNCQWFLFLRNHDELTLEMVTKEDRDTINKYYLHDSRWGFRIDEGISARLADLFQKNPHRIALANSIMLTMKGTPIIYYGDEFGRTNDEENYQQISRQTGYPDSRFFVRGKICWKEIENELENETSFSAQVLKNLKQQLQARSTHKAFGRGSLEWYNAKNTENKTLDTILAYWRIYENDKIFVIQNLSDKMVEVNLNDVFAIENYIEIIGNEPVINNNIIELSPFAYYWFGNK